MKCTLDKLCRYLGMSKKTIYRNFANKKDLEFESLIYLCHKINIGITEIQENKLQVQEEFRELSLFWFTTVINSPTYDIFFSKEMMPRKNVTDLPNNSLIAIKDAFRENLRKGIQLKTYHANFNYSVILNFYWSLINSLNRYTANEYGSTDNCEDINRLIRFHLNSISHKPYAKND